jgi:hypothetical protein
MLSHSQGCRESVILVASIQESYSRSITQEAVDASDNFPLEEIRKRDLIDQKPQDMRDRLEVCQES